VGRTLDLLHEAGTQRIFSELAMRAVVNHKISTRTVHFDTTSVHVYGEYRVDEASSPPFEIVAGYSKDHRPDLKQFLPLSILASALNPSLLVLDVNRLRIKSQDFLGCQERGALLGVVVVKELKAGVLHGFGDNVIPVGIPL